MRCLLFVQSTSFTESSAPLPFLRPGHMKLHAKNIAIMAGASGDQIDVVASKLVTSGRVDLLQAKKIVAEMNPRAKL